MPDLLSLIYKILAPAPSVTGNLLHDRFNYTIEDRVRLLMAILAYGHTYKGLSDGQNLCNFENIDPVDYFSKDRPKVIHIVDLKEVLDSLEAPKLLMIATFIGLVCGREGIDPLMPHLRKWCMQDLQFFPLWFIIPQTENAKTWARVYIPKRDGRIPTGKQTLYSPQLTVCKSVGYIILLRFHTYRKCPMCIAFVSVQTMRKYFQDYEQTKNK